MKKLYLVLLFALAVLALPAAVTVLSSTGYNSRVEFALDDYYLEEMDSFVRLGAPKMMYPHLSGAPALPFTEFKIALPPSGSIAWHLTILEEEQLTLNKRVAPVPYISEQKSGVSQHHYIIDEGLYAQARSSYITEQEPDVFRGYSFVTLRVSPFKYDGQHGVSVLKRALISVTIDGDVSYKAAPVQDDLAEVFMDAVINPSQAKHWQNHHRASINYAPFANADYWLKIEVDKDGIQQLNRQNLSSLPLDDVDPRTIRMFSTGGAINTHTVNSPGPEFREIPIKVIGEEDGHFDASDKILFYGENRDGLDKTENLTGSAPTIHNPYSLHGVYWLTFGGSFSAPPLRMQMQDSSGSYDNAVNSHKASGRFEKETYRLDDFGFDWYSDKLYGNKTADYLFNIELSDVVIGAESRITVRMRPEERTLPPGVSEEDAKHKVRLWVNDEEMPPPSIGYFSWSGPFDFTLNGAGGNLREGENQVRIQVIRNITDNIMLDFIQIDYQQKLKKREGQYFIAAPESTGTSKIAYQMQTDSAGLEVYRIDSFADVTRVPWQSGTNTFISPGSAPTKFVIAKPSEYHSPASVTKVDPQDLTADKSQVDHIIISPAEFLTQASTLASMYQEFHGLSVRIVDQADILNQFNGGHPDPYAIRQYLRYIYKNINASKLQGVTLLGVGTIDWRNKSRLATPKNKLMVYVRGQASSDDYYVMMDSSYYPELIIGRYPVRTAAELDIMLSNYRAYVGNPTPGWWRNSMVLLADDLYNGSRPGAESYHTRDMEATANSLHKSIRLTKIFAWEYDYDEFQNKPAARDDMIAAINEGVLVWYYTGHGAYDSLGSEDYFNGATDLGRLHNEGKLPLFVAASCSVSDYDHWGFDSLGQKVVMMNNIGSIASFAATRMSSGPANATLMDLLFNEMTYKRHPIGKSIMAAKFNSTNDGNDSFYILLGDPTLSINTPARDSLMSVDNRGLRATVRSGQQLSGKGHNVGEIETRSDKSTTLRSRQQPSIAGSLSPFSGNGTANLRLYDSGRNYTLGDIGVSQQGSILFKGDVSVNNGSYQGGFIVPDDITNGTTGSILCYLWDEEGKQDYINYLYPVSTSDDAVAMDNDGPPKIELFVETEDFRPGDTVSTNTTLIAKISDNNGINITDSAGHHILLVIDDALQPIPVTQYFSYNKDSFTAGTLRYPLPKMSEGTHSLQLIAFDNLNLPSVANTHFVAKHTSELSIQRLLPYPNPMQDEGYITFMLSEDASLDIGIYTVTGKRVKRIKTMGREGFNQIPIDTKDHNGNSLANNTYFIKVKAKAASKSTEATERLVIYK